MSYIGIPPQANFSSGLLDRFTSTTGTTVTLTHDIASENDIVVFVNFVKQDSTTYSVGGTGNKTLTLGGTLVSSDIVEVHYLNIVGQTNAPSSGSVGSSQLTSGAVTGAKLNTDVISAQTELASGVASTDELLISDGGVLKRVDVSLVGGTNTPAFHCGQTSTQTLATGTFTKLVLDATETLDTDNAFSSSRFTPQTAGNYFIYGSLRFNDGADFDNMNVSIYKNGTDKVLDTQGSHFHYETKKVSGIVNLNGSSDYVELFGRQTSGGNLNTRPSDGVTGNQTYFGGYKLIT